MAQIHLTSIPIVTIIVCVVLGLNALSGALRGFVRKISGIVAFILAGILVTSLLPVVTSWLHTTPVYGFIRQQCETIGGNIVKNTIPAALGGQNEGTPSEVSAVIDSVRSDDGSGALDRDKIKARLQAMGYDPSMIDTMSDAELENYAQMILGASAGMIAQPFLGAGANWVPDGLMSIGAAWVPDGLIAGYSFFSPALLEEAPSQIPEGGGAQGVSGSDLLSRLTAGMDRVDQTKFIESLPLPQSIKDQMEAFNNENGYLRLGAKDFGSYIINYIANLIMNILAYGVTLLAVWLLIRLVLGALAVFRSLPIVGTADHVLGLVLGLLQGLLIVWGLFLVLSLFSTTPVGMQLMQEINASAPLSFLYNVNPFLNSAAGAIKGIM